MFYLVLLTDKLKIDLVEIYKAGINLSELVMRKVFFCATTIQPKTKLFFNRVISFKAE
jgi:hypothetical protein